MNVNEISPGNVKRIGKKEETRPRQILLEFTSNKERNYVKKKSVELNDSRHPFFLKADRPKAERLENRRLNTVKTRLELDGSYKNVDIKYGKLYVDGTFVDQVNLPSANTLFN